MRISDWSSDVCSSDLGRFDFGRLAQQDDGDAPVARRPGLLRDEVLLVGAADDRGDALGRQIGRASCRERVGQYVSISVVAVTLKNKTYALEQILSLQYTPRPSTTTSPATRQLA